MPTIIHIVRKTKPSPPDAFERTPAEAVTLRADHGIVGDLKAGRSATRQLNIMAAEEVERLAAEGYQTAPGQLGEQIIISGLPALQPGDQLRLGPSAIIEVTKPRTGCDKFATIHGLPAPPVPRLGLMARVVASGPIAVGDAVQRVVPVG